MMLVNKISILAALVALAITTAAQNDTLLNREVEVIKAYQPSISDAYKITTSPKIQDNQSYTPTFEYQIKNVPTVNSNKDISHLPVVQLGNPPAIKHGTGFIKGGFGNAITPYGEFVFNTAPSRNTDFGFQLFHFSSQPEVKLTNELKTEAPYSNNLARFFVKNYFKKSVLDWEVKYDRQRVSYYGFPGTDTTFYNFNRPLFEEKQVHNNASTAFKLKSLNSRRNLDYELGLNYNYYWNTTEQSEHDGNFTGLFTSHKRKYDLAFDTKAQFFLINGIQNPYTADSSHMYIHAGVSPYIILNENKNWMLKAGANVGLIIDNDTSATFHISPKTLFEYYPIPGIIALFTGTDGGLKMNNYAATTAKNPYMAQKLDLLPSQTTIEIFGGIKGKISRGISYIADVEYAIEKDVPFFYYDQVTSGTSTILSNQFNVITEDYNSLRFGGKVHYSGANFLLTLAGNFYSYQVKNGNHLPHLPLYDAMGELKINLSDQLSIKADAQYIGGREALINKTSAIGVLTSEEFALKDIISVSAGADYQFTKNIKFFVDAKNILNQNYEVWHGYNSQGILIMLGGSFSF